MARWLLLAVAGALCAGGGGGVGAARYVDYSAARMPQYGAFNYDAHAASPPDEGYRDRSADVSVPIDYNNYDQSNGKRNQKGLDDDDSWQVVNDLRKEPAAMVRDDDDSDYNYKSEKITSRMKYGRESSRNRIKNKSKIKEDVLFTKIPRLNQNANVYQQASLDDEDTEPRDDEKDLDTESDKSKFVRRDIRQKVRRKFGVQTSTGSRLSDADYDDQTDVRQVKDAIKAGNPAYYEPEPPQMAPNGEPSGVRSNRPLSRSQGYRSSTRDGTGESQMSSTYISDRHKAPMPGDRKKNNEYVDYNDMSRIEKIKNLSARRTTARWDASRRWSYQDSFRRRNFDKPQATEEVVLTTVQNSNTTPQTTTTGTVRNTTSPPQPIAELSKDVIENITAFLNMSKQLSIAEKSQLSILKKAQRKDSVKDEMLKNKPPVLLQVTQRLQTVVMVEPPVSQEPWLRARDIAEDSPERIEKVKRFMRNKLVANARNISELMENWDDTVCDYIDISLLDESSASVRTCVVPIDICLCLLLWVSLSNILTE